MKNLFVNRAPIIFLLAAICGVDCAEVVPDNLPEACNPDRLPGGLVQVLIASCDLDFAAETDSVENLISSTFWDTAIAANKLKATGRVKGKGFDNSETTEDTDSCLSAEVSGREWTATIVDFNFDLTTNLDRTFWNTMLTKGRSQFQCAFRDSLGNLYTLPDGSWFNFTLSTKLTVPDSCKNFSYRELAFKWLSIQEPLRTNIPFINDKFPI